MAVSFFKNALFQSTQVTDEKIEVAKHRESQPHRELPTLSVVDKVADANALRKKSNLARARAMFHFHKDGKDAFNYTEQPLRGLNLELFKERVGELIAGLGVDKPMKKNLENIKKIEGMFKNAHAKLHQLSVADAEKLSGTLDEIQKSIEQVKFFSPTRFQAVSESISQMTTVLRRSVLSNKLQQVKQHFSDLLEKNYSPDYLEYAYDTAMMPLMIAAENKRSPNLKLSLLSPSEDFGVWIENWQQQNQPGSTRVILPLPGRHPFHYVTADIKCDSEGNISVLVVDPVGVDAPAKKAYEKDLLSFQEIFSSKTFASKIKLTVVALDTQKSTTGCRTFALSAASKMVAEADFFDVLHKQNLGGQLETAKGHLATTLVGQDAFKVIDGKGVMPISFFKHSQSKTTLEEWLAQNPSAFANAEVNKKEQTLLERYDSHKTTRVKKTFDGKGDKVLNNVGTSIEKKRLTYIDRALEYVNQASDSELSYYLQYFNQSIEMGNGMPEPGNLNIDKRKVGPKLDIASAPIVLS